MYYLGQWIIPSTPPVLADDTVHVWRTIFDLHASHVAQYAALLSPDEHARAQRFHFDQDRRRFIIGRGVLRTLLGHYLDSDPAAIHFCHNPYGKPAVADGENDGLLTFNLSHARDLALFAFTRQRAIGVDVEHINRDLDYAAIAQRFFAPTEYAYLCALPAVLQPLAFFTCWTRKEAFIKAHGEGLSLPLNQFVVTMDAGKPARLLQTAFAPAEADRWLLNELRPGAGYAAALAVEGRGWRLSSFDWRPHP